MEIRCEFSTTHYKDAEVQVYGAYAKDKKAVLSGIDKELVVLAKKTKQFASFTGEKGQVLSFIDACGCKVLFVGMGDKSKVSNETLRHEISKLLKAFKDKNQSVCFSLDTFTSKAKMESFA